jgi:hypothetical protein
MAIPRDVTATVFDEVFDFLISAPSLAQVTAFRPSETAQERVRYLLAANREETLTLEERQEMDEIGRVEHVMRMLKIRALENKP